MAFSILIPFILPPIIALIPIAFGAMFYIIYLNDGGFARWTSFKRSTFFIPITFGAIFNAIKLLQRRTTFRTHIVIFTVTFLPTTFGAK